MDVAPSAGGRREAVAEVLGDRQDELRAFVRARVHSDQVEDILQHAALRAIERSDSLDDPDRAMAWVYRIHRNLIVDLYRQQAREQRNVPEGDLYASAAIPDLAADITGLAGGESCECSVVQARRLRPSYATILTLVDSDGLKLREAAEQLNVSPNNAAVRLHRARRALREAMFQHCGVRSAEDCADCRCIEDACCPT